MRQTRGDVRTAAFSAGSGRGEIYGAFRNDLKPAAKDFRPDFVIISAGFDSRMGDPVAVSQ